MKRSKLPHFNIEKEYWKKGYQVFGIDEVGRGAFAGPLTVASVIFDNSASTNTINIIEKSSINDSKKLSPVKREKLEIFIKDHALYYDFFDVSVGIINKIGIQNATSLAVRELMGKCIQKLSTNLFLLMDGFHIKYVKGLGLKNQKGIPHGDTISISIAAASILAKVHRDKIMSQLSNKYPEYGFATHKGYGTIAHRNAIIKYGICPEHRTDYVRKYINK